MDSVTEIVSLSLKSAEASDPVLQILKDTLLKQPGCQRLRWGVVFEDATKARCFIDWDDMSRHAAFATSPAHAAYLESLAPHIESPPESHHVQFTPPAPTPVLDNQGGKGKTPVTEILYMHFLGDETFTPEMKDTAWANVQDFLTKTAPIAPGCTGETAMGWVMEKVDFRGEPCRAMAVLGGWESVEKHQKFRGSPDFGAAIAPVQRTAGIKGVAVVHVTFTTFE